MNAFTQLQRPLAISMWDFSWLERRWPGAGYEDWDRALDEFAERGYDALRIDAYPHLVAADPMGQWDIIPPWNQQIWGSPARIRVQVLPALIEFLEKCAQRGLKVGLSTWFQNDVTGRRNTIASPRAHAGIWAATLEHVEKAGLLGTLLYVDFCNEWPLDIWAPFFPAKGKDWRSPQSLAWMRESIAILKERYPEIPLTYSLTTDLEQADRTGTEIGFLDFLEPHRWMANATDFYDRVGYGYERFDSAGYENVVKYAETLYRSDAAYWQSAFSAHLDTLARWSEKTKKALITTEGWAVVDYKDWPGLDWGWVKELSAWAVGYVAATGRWAAICTSNFCGPQFHGMWRDIEWHQRLTKEIHRAKLPASPDGQERSAEGAAAYQPGPTAQETRHETIEG